MAEQQPEIPTVTSERRPVQLPDAPTDGEAARMARVTAALTRSAAQPPAETSPVPAQVPTEPQAVAAPPEAAPAVQPPPPALPPEFMARLETMERMFGQFLERQAQPPAPPAPTPDLTKWQTFEQKLREEDALAALETLGVTFDDLSRAVVNGRGTVSETDRVNGKVQTLEQKIEALQQQLLEQQQAAIQAQGRAMVTEEISTRSPVLAKLGDQGVDLVVKYLSDAHDQVDKGQLRALPSLEQAISAVEAQIDGLFQNLWAVESLRAKYAPPAPAPGQRETAAPVSPGRVQLTNETVAAPPKRSTETTEDERLARAVARLRK